MKYNTIFLSRSDLRQIGMWFSTGTPVSSTNKTDHITEILLKVALNTIALTPLKKNINSLLYYILSRLLTKSLKCFITTVFYYCFLYLRVKFQNFLIKSKTGWWFSPVSFLTATV